MGFNKKFYQTGGLVASTPPSGGGGLDPLQNFETVTYTGNGSTQKITGYIRKGAAFNGSSSYIDLGSITLGGTNNITVSMWVNPASSQTAYATIFDDEHENIGGFVIHQNNTSLNQYFIGGKNSSGTFVISSNFSLTANAWNHLSVTIDSSGNYVIYVNNSVATSGSGLTGFNTTISNPVKIGRYSASSARYWNGKIDQVRIFNTVLDQSQVGQLALETYADPKKSTTDYFGNGTGVALYELDDSAVDTGTTGVAIDSGQSGGFNGSTSFIDLSIPNATQNTIDSVFAWVKFNSLGTNQAITLLGDSTADNASLKLYLDSPTNKIRLVSTNTSKVAESIYSTTIINANTWYNVGAVWTGSSWKLYINGVNEATTSSTTSRVSSVGNTVYLGQWYRSGFTNQLPLNGFLDEVRFYTDVITDVESGYIYNNSSIPTDNLLSYYKLDGNANDTQGSYNGTWGGTEAYSDPAYTGQTSYNGTATNVNYLGMAFQPDLVWIKGREGWSHVITDSVRGSDKSLNTNKTDEEKSPSVYGAVGSFDSNGFTTTLGSSGLPAEVSYDNQGYVAWCWKAGGAVTPNNNTNGTIPSTVSANPDAGFSIVSTQSDGSGYLNFGHGLSQAPELVITKFTSQAGEWYTYTSAISNGFDVALKLNSTDAAITAYGTNKWSATSTVVAIGNPQWYFTANVPFITYCFHSVPGYQKVGSYIGTGLAGNFQDCGFKPRFVMLKSSTLATNWNIFDNVRGASSILQPNLSQEEGTYPPDNTYVITENGFSFTGYYGNDSGQTFIYLAIA